MYRKKAVVVSPSICDFYFTPGRGTALGAISVQNQLTGMGIESRLLNLPLLSPRGKKIAIHETHEYIKPFITGGERGPLGFFQSYKRFGPSPEESAAHILSTNPDIIFISLFAWAYARDAVLLAEEIKKIPKSKKVTLCIGGAGVAVLPEYFGRQSLFDFIITGDGEQVIPPFIKELDKVCPDFSKVPHLYGIRGSEAKISMKLPEPVLSLRRDKGEKQWLSLILSRGCPLKCRFCSNHLTQGRTFRPTPVDQLKEALNNLDVSLNNPLHINLEDDNLLIRKTYFGDILNMLKELFPHATFSIENGLDYTCMSPEYIDYLIDTGFNGFTLSLGSSNLNILRDEQRPADLEKLESILGRIKKRNIPVKTFMICGLPGDNKETILSSLLYLHSLPTQIGLSLFYPVPGIDRFEDKTMFLDKSPRLCSGSSAYPWSGSLTTGEMVTSFRLARLSNLIKKKEKSPKEVELINIIKGKRVLYTFQGKLMKIIPVTNMDEYLVSQFLDNLKNIDSFKE